MMKKNKICLLIAVLSSISVFAQHTLTSSDLTVVDGRVTNCSYDFSDKDIIFPDTIDGQQITSISTYSFYDKGIESVQLPLNLKFIDDWVFYNNNIHSIIIPDSVEIRDGVFNNNAITEINGETTNGIFYGIDEKGKIDSTTIASYGGVKHIIDFIPTNVTTIANWAFTDNGLTEISIPASVTSIGHGAFNNNHVTSVNGNSSNGLIYQRKPDGTDDTTTVVSYSGQATIINLLGSNVTHIGPFAFSNSSITEVSIPNQITFIGNNAFEFNNISKLTFEANSQLKTIGNKAFYDNTGLNLTLPNISIPGFTGWLDEVNKTYLANTVVSKNLEYKAIIPYTLTDSDVEVIEGNIKSCNKINGTVLTIPNELDGQKVIGIRSGVFNAEEIVTVYPPDHSANIPSYKGWISYLGSNVERENGKYYIRDFSKTYIVNQDEYTLTSFDVTMDTGCIVKCNTCYAIGKIIIPEQLNNQNVTAIGDGVFHGTLNVPGYNDKFITSVKFPNTLKHIGENAFSTNKLNNITIPKSVEIIDQYAFTQNYFLKQVQIESGSELKKIAAYAFESTPITTINLPSGLEHIGDLAFYSCKLSGVLNIPNTVTYIGEHAFSSNIDVANVVFTGKCDLIRIGHNGLACGTKLQTNGVKLPESYLPDFIGWLSLMSDKMYNEGEVTHDITTGYVAQYPYTLHDDDVEVVNGYITLFHKRDDMSSHIIIPEILDGQVVKGIADVQNTGVFYSANFKKVTLPNTIEHIGDYAFNGNHLGEILLPENLITIGKKAFWFNKIKKIDFTSCKNLTKIGESSFYHNELSTIALPNTLEHIGLEAFADNKIEDVYLPPGVKYIGPACFNDNVIKIVNQKASNGIFYKRTENGIDYTSIVSYGDTTDVIDFIPTMVTTIESYAFNSGKSNNRVKKIVIPANVQLIEYKAFDIINTYPEIVIENNSQLRFIGHYALPLMPSNGADTFMFPKSAVNGLVDWCRTDAVPKYYVPETPFSFIESSAYRARLEVQFIDFDSTILKTEKVLLASDATSPTNPIRTGYTFVGWDIPFVNIQEGVVVTAQYSQNGVVNYTVTFNNWDNTNLKTETVVENAGATAPANPTRTGYTFSGWDTDFTQVTGDLTVTAQYNLATSINKVVEGNMNVYPNPVTNGWLNVESNQEVNNLCLFNQLGNIVYSNYSNEKSQSINVSSLPCGMYYLKVNEKTIKVIVK